MSKARAFATAATLFIGVVGTMGPLGALIFEEAFVPLAIYSTGVTAGASWLAAGTYRTSRHVGENNPEQRDT